MTDTAASMRAIVSELSTQLIERRPHVEAVAITLLAGKNALLLGPPGTAKSLLIKMFAARFVGCEYFEALLDKQLGKEELFGQYNLPLYDKEGVWERDINGMLPMAHIAFVDEVGKAGPAVLNPLLKIFNEREYKHGRFLTKTPLVSAFGASNELLEDELEAFWDRFLIRMWVNYVKEPASFVSLIRSAVVTDELTAPTTLGLSQLLHAVQVEVPKIGLPDAVATDIATLWRQVKNEGMEVSDRRWRESIRLLQASAYLNGRTDIDDDDFLILRHVLWSKPDEVHKVTELVTGFASEAVRTVIGIEKIIDDLTKEMEGHLADVAAGKSSEPLSMFRIDAKAKVGKAHQTVVKLKVEAQEKNKSSARLDQVAVELQRIDLRILHELMNLPLPAAMSAVETSWTDYPQ